MIEKCLTAFVRVCSAIVGFFNADSKCLIQLATLKFCSIVACLWSIFQSHIPLLAKLKRLISKTHFPCSLWQFETADGPTS